MQVTLNSEVSTLLTAQANQGMDVETVVNGVLKQYFMTQEITPVILADYS